jgi:hypothetical protein
MQEKTFTSLEAITSLAHVNYWSLSTTQPLKAVLAPGFFNEWATHNLRRHDRVTVTASALAPEPELAELIVTAADKSSVQVRAL